MRTTLIPVLALVTACTFQGPERATIEEISPLVSEYAIKQKPKLNPNTRFKIEEFKIEDLWKTLGVQVFLVRFISSESDEQFNECNMIYHAGQLQIFASAFGGFGLMSGVVHNDCFYYTYSFGSGMHRSHIGRLRISEGKIDIVESNHFIDQDLFVKIENGQIKVESGGYKAFNEWSPSKLMGIVKEVKGTLEVHPPNP